jgi:hypothetical protein
LVPTFLTLIAGAVTTGTAQAAATFNVQTSVDVLLATAPATVALGGQLTNWDRENAEKT